LSERANKSGETQTDTTTLPQVCRERYGVDKSDPRNLSALDVDELFGIESGDRALQKDEQDLTQDKIAIRSATYPDITLIEGRVRRGMSAYVPPYYRKIYAKRNCGVAGIKTTFT
jgi:hypothetical protein